MEARTVKRTFHANAAVRERVPLLIGLAGPSGGGKTFSALRLATGIQSVTGGEIFAIDTEAGRMKHYADVFKFKHVPFGAPFGSLDYLAAIEFCVNEGASVVIVDSMSHEHEGPGGMLEFHEAEAQRLSRQWKCTIEKAKMSAWQKPKAARRRLINGILQMPVNLISCFRAKNKIKVRKGEDPIALGYMPIAGEEFVFEQTVCALLLPGAGGVPSWHPEESGEQQMVKMPGWARDMFAEGKPLDEETGARLAKWAAGTVVRTTAQIIAAYGTCSDPATLGTLEAERRAAWNNASASEKLALKTAADGATARVKAAEVNDEIDPETGEVTESADALGGMT